MHCHCTDGRAVSAADETEGEPRETAASSVLAYVLMMTLLLMMLMNGMLSGESGINRGGTGKSRLKRVEAAEGMTINRPRATWKQPASDPVKKYGEEVDTIS